MLNMPVDEIKKKIQEQTELSLQEINVKVQDKMKQLSGLISEEGACHIIANELSVDLIPKAEDRKVKDLIPGLRDVNQALKIIQVYELRTFQSKFSDGEGKVCSFLGGDETGVIRVTCWGMLAEPASKLKPGDIVKLKNGYIKDNNGRAELHLNDKSRFEINPEGVNVETSSSSRQEGNQDYERKTIKDISRGDYRVELLGTIVQVYEPRFFDRKDGSGRGGVMNMLLDDGTGNIRCALWSKEAAAALGIDEDTFIKNGEQAYDEERTALLGKIILVKGRAKLNEQYNSIDMNVDELNLDPDPEKEGAESVAAINTSENIDESVEKEEVEQSTSADIDEPSSDTSKPEEKEDVSESVTEVKDAPPEPQSAEDIPNPEEAPELGESKSDEKAKKAKPADDEPISLDDLDDIDVDDI